MDLLSKAKLFSNYNLAFGKTHKAIQAASEYLPKDFSALAKIIKQKSPQGKLASTLAEDHVIHSFHKVLSKKLDPFEFEQWKISMKAAVISKKVCTWTGHENLHEVFMTALNRDLALMILRNEDKTNYKNFEQRALEGRSVTEAAMITFGISLDQYVAQFAKYFNYKIDNEKDNKIIDFAYHLAEGFSDKDQKASDMWIKSQKAMHTIGLEMDEDEWANHISILFVKTLEVESKFNSPGA